MALEIEKKFLMKPLIDYTLFSSCSKCYYINQVYILEEGQIVRYRLRQQISQPNNFKFSDKVFEEAEYFRTTKRKVGDFTFEETEIEITEQEFHKIDYSNGYNNIWKFRWIWESEEQNLKFEIDEFFNKGLTIMEVELLSEDQEFTIPEYLQKNIIVDVTGLSQFSNYNLSRFANLNK